MVTIIKQQLSSKKYKQPPTKLSRRPSRY